MRYDIYEANGTRRERMTHPERLTLEQLQEIVGGDIEFTPADRFGERFAGLTACVNEDGIGMGLPLNKAFMVLKGHSSTDAGTTVFTVEEALFGTVIIGRDVETYDGREFNGL